jgi:phosphopantetheinyl transferase
MSPDQKKKILSFKKMKDKKLCFASEFLKNYFSSKHGFNIVYDNNKPIFENQDIFFSISHSGNYCVYIEDKYPIGIDIQEPNMKYNDSFIRK